MGSEALPPLRVVEGPLEGSLGALTLELDRKLAIVGVLVQW